MKDQELNWVICYLKFLIFNITNWTTLLLPYNDLETHLYKSSINRDDVFRLQLSAREMDRLQFMRVLSTPEYLASIHPAISGAHTLDVIDSQTKIIRIYISSGWTKTTKYADLILNTFYNQQTVVSVATSIDPQSEEPHQYAQIPLLAWSAVFSSHGTKINHYWQWNIKNQSNTASIMSNLVDVVASTKDIPFLNSFKNLALSKYSMDTQRNRLSFNADVSNDINETSPQLSLVVLGEFAWDVHASSDCDLSVTRHSNTLLIQMHLTQSSSVSIEKTTGTPSSVRFNGIIKTITDAQETLLTEALPKSSAHKFHANSIMQELSNSSKQEEMTLAEESSEPNTSQRSSSRTPDQASEIASMIRRNYTYFSSLLQEPEAKWRHVSDSKGVSITQLDTIDPNLILYRGQGEYATFHRTSRSHYQ